MLDECKKDRDTSKGWFIRPLNHWGNWSSVLLGTWRESRTDLRIIATEGQRSWGIEPSNPPSAVVERAACRDLHALVLLFALCGDQVCFLARARYQAESCRCLQLAALSVEVHAEGMLVEHSQCLLCGIWWTGSVGLNILQHRSKTLTRKHYFTLSASRHLFENMINENDYFFSPLGFWKREPFLVISFYL